MDPVFRETMLRNGRRELEERVRRASVWWAHRFVEAPLGATAVLRLARVRDDEALDRPAQLESRPTPRGQHSI
jgi:hypothetical protein